MTLASIVELIMSAVILCAGMAPSPGPTLNELRESVPVLVSEEAGYEQAPEDMEDIIYASAWKWMRYVFTELNMNGQRCPELEAYECTGLELFDVSGDGNVFCYSIKCEFRPRDEDGFMFWQPGNTVEAEREGWYRLSRQIAVGRDGPSWQVLEVGTGGVRADNYTS